MAKTISRVAEDLLRTLPRDGEKRTLPHYIPGPSFDAKGKPIPEAKRGFQKFADGEYIAVCGECSQASGKFLRLQPQATGIARQAVPAEHAAEQVGV
jgi:hypothetical protein